MFSRFLSHRLRLLAASSTLAFVFFVVTVKGQIDSYFTGNIALLDCLKGYHNGSLEGDSCRGTGAATSQQSTFEYLRVFTAWAKKDYLALTRDCHDSVCSCSISPSLGGKAALHQRMRSYYSVLSFRAIRGTFPRLDTCKDDFAPSSFIWNQSIASEDQEWALILWELAYIVDTGWQDPWQRGHTAYKQGELYYELDNEIAAEEAFRTAVESLLQTEDDRAPSYLSLSSAFVGELKQKSGEFESADVWLRQSIAYSPKSASRSYTGLISLWSTENRSIEKIVDAFKQIRESLGSSNPYLTAGPAQALLEIHELGAAWELIASAPLNVRRNPAVLVAEGRLHFLETDFERAEQLFKLALASSQHCDPRDIATIANHLSILYEAQERLPEAIASLEQAAELNPRSTSYWYRLAQLYVRQNRDSNARYALEQALHLDPSNEAFLKAYEELSRTPW